MKLRLLCFPLLLCFALPLAAQRLVSSTPLGSRTKAQLTSQFGLPIIQYGAKYYRVLYVTTDVQGMPDTASGLIVIPDDFNRVYPRLVYQHGTSSSKLDVPSYNVTQNGEGALGLLCAGLGYAALLPDYLGLGASDGFHPYVHAASEASAAADLLRALPEFEAQAGSHTNDQLFITGYSQGGHASMALQREIETALAGEFSVTAAAHNSGPYSISGVMRDLILSDTAYYFPAYLPNTILSYQTVYGGLFNQITDVFKEPYATPISQFYSGAISLDQLNTQLIGLLLANEGGSRPLRMLQPAMVQAVLTDPSHPFNAALRDNDVYAWAPQSPTRIFYCTADDQVPYRNSIVAADTMKAYGAVNLATTDVNPAADHGGCVTPALTNTILFFLGYQQVGAFVGTGNPVALPLEMQPNPAHSTLNIRNLPGEGTVTVTDLNGRLRLESAVSGGDQRLQVNELENGFYLVRYTSDGKIWQGKLAIQR